MAVERDAWAGRAEGDADGGGGVGGRDVEVLVFAVAGEVVDVEGFVVEGVALEVAEGDGGAGEDEEDVNDDADGVGACAVEGRGGSLGEGERGVGHGD